jgi:hypothetical protein
MAGDPLAFVRAGQAVDFSASTHNAFVEAARFASTRKNGGRFQPLEVAERGIVIPVRNDSGADRNRFDVLAHDGAVFASGDNLPQFKSRPALAGVVPAYPEHYGRFVVLQEPVKSGRIALAMVAGVTGVQLNLADGDAVNGHEWADIDDGQAGRLRSGATGAARVLEKSTSSGVGWGLVLLGGQGPSALLCRTPAGGIPASSGTGFPYTPGSASCDVCAWSGATLVDAGWNLTVFNASRTAVAGDELIQVKFVAGRALADFEDCTP